MDHLLCEPSNPISIAPEQTPYVCLESWDGGLFRTYAHRKGNTRIIPAMLRQVPDVPPAEQPYLESLYPTPPDELQPFLQTWLFFGMVAEMLSLNEVEPGGVWLMDKEAARAEIAELADRFTCSQDGNTFIMAKEILSMGPLFQERVALAPDKTQRLMYLCHCLQYNSVLLNSIEANVDHSLRYSIAALGELLTTGIYANAILAQPMVDLPVLGFSWSRSYIQEGGQVETLMLQHGWCPSEIEKIRSQVQGLHTMHFTSRLRKAEPWLDHSSCSKTVCTAFQLDIATYRPAHVDEACECELIEADAGIVSGILIHSNSFPVIRVDQHSTATSDKIEIHVEEYREETPYVALSHVWANGLGNPASNSLPGCQIRRIARLVAALPPAPGTLGPPRFWLDTLCCPIELVAKLISLERIADVYRKAHHVLVLDTTLTTFRYEGTHPAELLVRAFVCSPWMRRLWTLQEGALSRALEIQFADRAVNNMVLLTELFQTAREDARLMRIWQDVTHEFNQLLGFSPKTGPENTLVWTQPSISILQRALHFRTVSVPSDEALCISTLMKLDTKYIATGETADERMTRVWQKLAQDKGGIPLRVLFYLDDPIDIPGWRWAPRSLLASSMDDPVLNLDERVMRFHIEHTCAIGQPTVLGLKVSMPGYRIIATPILPELPLHPWPDVILPSEAQILVQSEATGQWFRILDWHRARKLPTWTRRERLAYDKKENCPLCRAIDTGTCAVLVDEKLAMEDSTRAGCLLQVEEASTNDLDLVEHIPSAGDPIPLKAHRSRAVIISRLSNAEGRMMNVMKDLARLVALDQSTAEYLVIQKSCKPGDAEWDAAEEKVRQTMKDVMKKVWLENTEVQQTIKDTIGEDMEEYAWVFIPQAFSHGVVLKDLEDQAWFVD